MIKRTLRLQQIEIMMKNAPLKRSEAKWPCIYLFVGTDYTQDENCVKDKALSFKL